MIGDMYSNINKNRLDGKSRVALSVVALLNVIISLGFAVYDKRQIQKLLQNNDEVRNTILDEARRQAETKKND
jgi:hypothetical protein